MVDPMPPDAAERALTDALTAPATPAELAREAEFVEAFRTIRTPLHDQIFATAAVQTPPVPAPPVHLRRRRLRSAVAGGLAAVAITGTAAAVSTTLTKGNPEGPSRSVGPLPPGSTSSARGSGTGTSGQASATGDGTRPGAAPGASGATTPGTSPGTDGGTDGGTSGGTSGGTNGGPTSAPGIPPAGTPSASHGSSPTTSTPGATPAPRPSTPSPSPSTTTKGAPVGELRAACKKFVKGDLKVGSHQYEVLVDAAGGIDEVPAFCSALLGG